MGRVACEGLSIPRAKHRTLYFLVSHSFHALTASNQSPLADTLFTDPKMVEINLPLTRWTKRFLSDKSPDNITSKDYLTGLRGTLILQSFFLVFFQIFVPTAVAHSKNVDGPLYATILRNTLSVIFWNESLIFSWFILLSARTLCLPYLSNPTKEVCASSIFKRAVRLWVPTFVAFSLSAAAFSTSSASYINDFLHITKNLSTQAPISVRNVLVYFNSLFNIFWVTRNYSSQAANQIFPSGALWAVSVIFQQSYTVYMTMITIPYTRTSWRVQAFLVFIITAWWVQSWAWYSITGLLLADAVQNMDFRFQSRGGWKVGSRTIPTWPLYLILIVVGWILQYLFVVWRPEYRNMELRGHTGLYNSGELNEGVDWEQPLARDDNFLVILGIMLLIETYDVLQRILRTKILVELGKRSFSKFTQLLRLSPAKVSS